jgi:hypothetical protein
MLSGSIGEIALRHAWSQWAELGVSASGAVVPQHAMDLEAAICFAPLLAELDPRLHDEVLDWCVQFGSAFVSVSVLKHTLKLFDQPHQQRVLRFTATVNAHAKTRWPALSHEVLQFTPSHKSRCRTERPGAVQLRARKIFGINARADIIVGLAQNAVSPQPQWTQISHLVGLGYSKRNLTDALNDLAIGGILGTLHIGNKNQYALRNHELLRELLAPMPPAGGRPWAQLLSVLASVLEVETTVSSKSAISQALAINDALNEHRDALGRVRINVPLIDVVDPLATVANWFETEMRP